MFFLDLFLYKIACLIWPDKREKDVQNSEEFYFWFEEFVEREQDDEDMFF